MRRCSARDRLVFICMIKKAVQLNFVSDLTSASGANLPTLKRFFDHHGKSSVIFSDNVTNFVRASAELKRLGKLLNSGFLEILSVLASEDIRWKLSPPRAHNFGSL